MGSLIPVRVNQRCSRLDSNDLLKRISDDLKKSGFASEMKALKAFSDSGWETSGIASYYDKDTDKTREFDLLAHHYLGQSVGESCDASSFYQIVGEVKKTNKPWVVFKEEPKDSWELEEGFSSLVFKDGINRGKPITQFSEAMSKSGIGYKNGWVGRGIHEAFKNPDQPSRWYPSLIGIAKAGEHELNANSWEIKKEREKPHPPYVYFVKPIVVVDGSLMAASVDENAEIYVEEVSFATVKFEFNTKNYTRRHYMIDLVQVDSLKKYINISEARHEKMFAAMLDSAGFSLTNQSTRTQ